MDTSLINNPNSSFSDQKEKSFTINNNNIRSFQLESNEPDIKRSPPYKNLDELNFDQDSVPLLEETWNEMEICISDNPIKRRFKYVDNMTFECEYL